MLDVQELFGGHQTIHCLILDILILGLGKPLNLLFQLSSIVFLCLGMIQDLVDYFPYQSILSPVALFLGCCSN